MYQTTQISDNNLMIDTRITFIGAGNMAYSLIGGLLNNGFSRSNMCAIDPHQDQRDTLTNDFNIRTLASPDHSIINSEAVVLAVKPQVMTSVLTHYKQFFDLDTTVFISIAAGITTAHLETGLSKNSAIVRCMPNTPALVQQGATVLYANAQTSEQQKHLASHVLSAVGMSLWTNHEEDLNAVTATSGSGPAYFFLLMEHMQASAEALGLESQQARDLVTQTALGAAIMAQKSELSLATLRENVTSKGGTTAAALGVFDKAHFKQTVDQALHAAAERSRQMANLFNGE